MIFEGFAQGNLIEKTTDLLYAKSWKENIMQPSSDQKNKDMEYKTRIQKHGQRAALPTQEAVDRRAREIATIEGRADGGIRADDCDRARRELQGETILLASDKDRSDIVASKDPADLLVETGHEVKTVQPVDEQQHTEMLIKKGVREAEHDRMLKGQDSEDMKTQL